MQLLCLSVCATKTGLRLPLPPFIYAVTLSPPGNLKRLLMYDKTLDPRASKRRGSIRLVLSAQARALHVLPVLMKAAFIKNPIKCQVPATSTVNRTLYKRSRSAQVRQLARSERWHDSQEVPSGLRLLVDSLVPLSIWKDGSQSLSDNVNKAPEMI